MAEWVSVCSRRILPLGSPRSGGLRGGIGSLGSDKRPPCQQSLTFPTSPTTKRAKYSSHSLCACKSLTPYDPHCVERSYNPFAANERSSNIFSKMRCPRYEHLFLHSVDQDDPSKAVATR